jgi:CRP/FNR family transcriptional regulator, cyclic AMP receptor protein
MPELIDLLENSPVLGKFTNAQRQEMAAMAVRRVLKRDKAIYRQGDDWTNVILIAVGQLRSVISALDGRSYIVTTWKKGDDFWPHSLFDGEPMPSTLEAAQDSVIYQWEGESVLRILFNNSDAMRALLGYEVRLIRKRRETIADLAFQSVTARLAKSLLERVPLSETSAQRDLTLDQIASTVASSPEVVCRCLYQLQRAGMLQVTRATITLSDRPALERLVGPENC